MNTDERITLTRQEVAARLGISERTTYTLVKSGELPPPIKIGGSVRWDSRSLEEWYQAKINKNQCDQVV